MTVTAVMLMGAKPEPFLSACLRGIRDAVDHVVLNDNSGLSDHPNLSVVRASELFKSGSVSIVPSPFLGFGPCRDLCLGEMRSARDANRWVLFVDCDEVHGPSLCRVTRGLLPELPPDIGIVDGYVYQIYQSRKFIIALEHRHNLLFRFQPELRWEGPVHEQLSGLCGRRLAVPYRYYHYGMLSGSAVIADKWRLYGSLGDEVSAAQSKGSEEILLGDRKRLTRFFGRHPAFAHPAIREYEKAHAAWLARYEESTQKQHLFRLRSKLRHWQILAKMRYLLWNARRQLAQWPAARAELDIY